MKVYLDSIGCRLNQSEIEGYARQFHAAGHELVASPEGADLVVVNTCAVTAAAASDSRQKVRQAARLGAREIAVTGLRGIAALEGLVIQASSLGKYKTIFQAAAVAGLSLHYEYFTIDFHAVGVVLFWIALVFTLWSGWAYFKGLRKIFSPGPQA